MSDPAVSVVLPTYNAERYIAAAVESVLDQTFRDFELIVVDDGSSDSTPGVLARFGQRIRRLVQGNGGVARARNAGIQASRGRWIAFLDADDTWSPALLDRQLAALRATPAKRAVYSAMTIVDDELRPLAVRRGASHDSSLQALLTRGNVVMACSNVVCETAVLHDLGGFDPSLSQCADWDMWVRVATRTDFAYVDEPLVNYRRHGANMSRDPRLLERDSVRVLVKGFALTELPPPLREWRRRSLARNYTVLGGSYFRARMYLDCARCLAKALLMDPRQLGYLFAMPLRALNRRAAARRTAG